MVARSVTQMIVEYGSDDVGLPTIQITSEASRTECEGGPAWVKRLLEQIVGSTRTSSSNLVTVLRRSSGDSAVAVSTVNLEVVIGLPPLLPIPIPAATLEKVRLCSTVLAPSRQPCHPNVPYGIHSSL